MFIEKNFQLIKNILSDIIKIHLCFENQVANAN